MLKSMRRRSEAPPGLAMVELAMVVTILSMVLLGVLELDSMFNAKSYLTDATRAAARQAALTYDDSTIANNALAILRDHGMDSYHGGQCDIREIDVYRAYPDGSMAVDPRYYGEPPPYPPPANPAHYATDVIPIAYQTGAGGGDPGCVVPPISSPLTAAEMATLQQICSQDSPPIQPCDLDGFTIPARQVQAPVDAPPVLVGVRIVDYYHLLTPGLAQFGPAIRMAPQAVLALGGDNANNFLDRPSSTPVPTFTMTDTPTVTDTPPATATGTPTGTATGTPTATGTATDTPSVTPTAPLSACQIAGNCPDTSTPTVTGTPTTTGTSTSTPTATTTATQTPVPPPDATLSVLCNKGTEVGYGIRIKITGGVPGASRYNVYYFSAAPPPPSPLGTALGSIVPARPGGIGQFPAPPPFFQTVAPPGYFAVTAVVGGVESLNPLLLPVAAPCSQPPVS